MSWIWPQYISPDLGLSAEERRAVYRDAWKLWARDRRNVLLYIALPVVYILIVPFANDLGGAAAGLVGGAGWPQMLGRAAAPIILLTVCFIGGGAVLQHYRFAPCVYRAARQRGHDVCTNCGYWLRGLPPTGNCPECGRARESSEEQERNAGP
jgi:hypothetical protein